MTASGIRPTLRVVLLTLRALATGVVVTLLFQFVVAIPVTAVSRIVAPRDWFPRWLAGSLLPGMMPALSALCAGWVVGRFHRERQARMVMSYAALVVILTLPRLLALVMSAATDARFVSSLLNYTLNMVVSVGGVLVGGLLLAAPRESGPGHIA